MKTKHNFFGFRLDKKFLILALLLIEILFGVVVSAQADVGSVVSVLTCLLCKVFQIIFWAAAGIAAIVILVAGIKWIGSGDDPSARGAAKSTIVHAIIGLIIVLISASIVMWVVGSVTAMTVDPTSFIRGDCVCPR